MARPEKVVSYDIEDLASGKLQQWADLVGVEWEFRLEDTSKVEIEETDFLFVDTEHSYEQVKAELKNKDKVRKFIGFHDTVSFPEIIPAIEEGIWHKVCRGNNHNDRLFQRIFSQWSLLDNDILSAI